MARTRIHGQQVTDGSIELVDLSSALASTISGKADAGNLAPVATSGSYNDLTNLPTLFSGAYADLTGKPTLFSGDYADLSNKPSLFDGNYSSLSGAPVLSTVATSGSYNDLSNLPTLFSGSYTDLTNKPILFSGSYDDLTNKPSIPSIVGLATETYVDTKVADLVASAPAVLDTLNELAAALGDDANFAATVSGQIGVIVGDVSALDVRVTAAEGDITGKADNSTVTLIASDVSDLTTRVTAVEGDVATLQTDVAAKADSASLALVATSGSYNDLSNLPTLFSGAYADLTGKPTLFSGSYNDLTDKPTFSSDLDGLTDVAITSPSADQVLKYNGTAWVNATAPATFSGSYTDLTNKPTLASFTTLTSPASGQYLKFNGSAWVNSAIAAADLPVAQSSAGILDTGFQIILGEKRFGSTIQASSMTSSGTTLSLSGGLAGTFPGGKIVFTGGNTTGSMDFYTKVNGQQFQEQIRANISDLGLFSMYYGASIQSGAAATKGLIVKGAASQSANLFEAQNSSGTVLASISSAGAANFASTITAVGAINFGISGSGMSLSSSGSYNGVALGRGTSTGESGLALGSYVSCGSNAMIIGWGGGGTGRQIVGLSSGEVGIGTATPGAQLHAVTKATTMKGLIIQGVASQTANLFEAQNSSGTALFSIDKDGSMAAGSVPVARVTGLHAVATSGSYNDLANKPSIPSIAGLATETYVDNAVAAVVNSAPAVLDTLNELAAALGDDPNFATTMTTALASKADTSSLAAVATSGSYVDLSNKPTIYTPVKEVFTALVDGTETEFVLADAPAVAGTEQVFVNGILQSAGASDDYTISGDTITFNTAPEAGWKLIVYYFV